MFNITTTNDVYNVWNIANWLIERYGDKAFFSSPQEEGNVACIMTLSIDLEDVEKVEDIESITFNGEALDLYTIRAIFDAQYADEEDLRTVDEAEDMIIEIIEICEQNKRAWERENASKQSRDYFSNQMLFQVGQIMKSLKIPFKFNLDSRVEWFMADRKFVSVTVELPADENVNFPTSLTLLFRANPSGETFLAPIVKATKFTRFNIIAERQFSIDSDDWFEVLESVRFASVEK